MSAKDDFIEASKDKKPPAIEELLKRAKLTWLVGKPAPSEDDLVGVAVSNDVTVMIPEDAIDEVEPGEQKGTYRIGIAPDTSVVITARTVMTLGGDCGCSCAEPSAESEYRHAASGFGAAAALAAPGRGVGLGPADMPGFGTNCPPPYTETCQFERYNCHPLAAFGLYRACYRYVCRCSRDMA